MSLDKQIKIQKVLQSWPSETVAASAWFVRLGVSPQLLRRYVSSNWIRPLAKGAYIKTGDHVDWQGGLYAVQTHSSLPIHAGALTALALQGYAHYVRMSAETVFLFSPHGTNLPAWFRNRDWKQPFHYSRTSFLPDGLALTDFQTGAFSIRIAAPERAILECLHLTPNVTGTMECYQIMEGLTTLRPKLLQQLLEQCSSIKAKRLFLYMASKAGHGWYKRLDVSKLKLGTGDRTITKGGTYVAQFGITVPEELAR
jgi:hypothetical protein